MWLCPPRLMCREHLLGEHSELHQISGTLANHEHGRAVVEGLAESGFVDTSLLEARHNELRLEMKRRGMDHGSPIDPPEHDEVGSTDREAVVESLWELSRRCPDCAHCIAKCDIAEELTRTSASAYVLASSDDVTAAGFGGRFGGWLDDA